MGPRQPARGPDDGDRHGDVPVPPADAAARRTPSAPPPPTPFDADLMISPALRGPAPARRRTASRSFHFGNSHGSVLDASGRCSPTSFSAKWWRAPRLRDCRTHGRTWDLLRLTKMPTVQVDVGYLTNDRTTAACWSTSAVARHDRRGHPDRGQASLPARQERSPTGTFTFAELLADELSVEPRPAASRSARSTRARTRRAAVSFVATPDSRSSAASTSAFHP